MEVLVINCGSSSLKFQLIDSDSEKVLAKGIFPAAAKPQAAPTKFCSAIPMLKNLFGYALQK